LRVVLLIAMPRAYDGSVREHAAMTVFNHVGHCVADLGRSRRFYEDVLGFEPWRELTVPDTPADRLMRLTQPVGLTACYLRRDGFVLELLHYSGAGAAALPPRERVMNEPGLTHVSVSVDDIDATCRQVTEHGGEVLADTNIGGAVMVRDPDGQLIELLPMAYAERMAEL
jgi:catechol 2,3-dioxygenase-like lactoylglutathione lyase family enzyme